MVGGGRSPGEEWIIWTDKRARATSDKWNKTGGVNEGEKWRCVWLEAEYKILRGR